MRLRAQGVVLITLLALGAAQLIHFIPQMPERIATHFGRGGYPNGWMTHTGFIAFEVAMLAFLTATMVGSALVMRILPARLINVPHRDYWFAPERRREASSRLLNHMLWLVNGIWAFFIAINHLLFVANQAEGGPRLPEKPFIWLLVLAVLALAAWMWRMLVLFRRPPNENTGNQPSKTIGGEPL